MATGTVIKVSNKDCLIVLTLKASNGDEFVQKIAKTNYKVFEGDEINQEDADNFVTWNPKNSMRKGIQLLKHDTIPTPVS